MSNYKAKDNHHQQNELAFSFSQAKASSPETRREKFVMSASERRGLAGWLSAVMHPHSEQFLVAIRNSQTRGVVDLFNYITHNYPHLKEIVRYFIVALLVDYGWTDWSEEAKGSKTANDVFLNILIEDIAARFYRESQWMVKIIHMPLYQIFSSFDTYSKGYLTISDLSSFLRNQLKYQQPKKATVERHCLQAKLKCNLGGYECKIYQQNLKQLQYRTDLLTFNQQNLIKSQDCSQAYSIIFSILAQQIQNWQRIKATEERQSLMENKRALEELDINRQDLNIKMLSKSYIEPHRHDIPSAKPSPNCKQGGLLLESKKEALTNSKALSQTRMNLSKNTYLAESRQQQPPIYQRPQQIAKQHKQNLDYQMLKAQSKQLSDLVISQALIQQRLRLKQSILCELQHIKFQKYHNRSNLLSYI